MGNEQSQLPGIEIEKKAVEVCDFWSQHTASINDSNHPAVVSVFVGEVFVSGSLWTTYTPLEKNSKNLKIYRHPCIIKYISSWQKNSKFYLAVEEVKPLSQTLLSLNTLQLCIGLHSILKALCFLHDKAQVSHNNICIASIYVSKEGNWKLGGMEYLCRYSELTPQYLTKSKNHRYGKAMDTDEDIKLGKLGARKDIIDVYAYGVLVSETLRSKSDDEIPSLSSFRDYCKSFIVEASVEERPSFGSVLKHEFFNHDFINIHSFLTELPLKADDEKKVFFSTIATRLKLFNEVTVASQLGSLLLCRMVLLNKDAQEDLLPVLLTYRKDSSDDFLFSEETFKKHLVPKIVEIFSVRDAQIRLVLLKHFNGFINAFNNEELQTCVLPELLLGIKDTNDVLVSATLLALAQLVPILGAAVVIGGKRAKLFNDGRPTSSSRRSRNNSSRNNEALNPPVLIEDPGPSNVIYLPERQRPDGEEMGNTSAEEIDASADEELDNWEDWETNEAANESSIIQLANESNNLEILEMGEESTNEEIVIVSPNPQAKRKSLPDINDLDIKTKTFQQGDDFDFFQDMEPVIETSSKYLIKEPEIENKLSIHNADDIHEEGWGDEDWE